MSELKQKIQETSEFLKSKTKVVPQIGIILGTGLGGLVKEIEIIDTISYETIPNFPVSTVESHAGKLIFGRLSGKYVMAMQGRFHFYEGYSLQQVTFPVRVMKAMGVRTLIVSNACGGVNPAHRAGDIMLISDHINLMGGHPLIGKNDETLGPRFPDMYDLYDQELLSLAESVALEEKIKVQKGVYLALTGPTLETGAEYRMVRILGADVVGMSTVPEVIVARHSGLKVMGFSIITDMGFPEAMRSVSLEEVIAVAGQAEVKFVRLVKQVVAKMQ
ncbi:purine-nucleoside phosphorylase [candidate division TA06 bacterium]|nr:purine-nucleoside phosphorylase [candidate division TA06 bacterium]